MPALENEFLDLLDVLHIIDVVDFDTWPPISPDVANMSSVYNM